MIEKLGVQRIGKLTNGSIWGYDELHNFPYNRGAKVSLEFKCNMIPLIIILVGGVRMGVC